MICLIISINDQIDIIAIFVTWTKNVYSKQKYNSSMITFFFECEESLHLPIIADGYKSWKYVFISRLRYTVPWTPYMCLNAKEIISLNSCCAPFTCNVIIICNRNLLGFYLAILCTMYRCYILCKKKKLFSSSSLNVKTNWSVIFVLMFLLHY